MEKPRESIINKNGTEITINYKRTEEMKAIMADQYNIIFVYIVIIIIFFS